MIASIKDQLRITIIVATLFIIYNIDDFSCILSNKIEGYPDVFGFWMKQGKKVLLKIFHNGETMKLFETDFNEQTGIRKVIMDKSKEIMSASGKEAVILIKSMDNAKYGNLVDMLDEMHITNQKIYAIVDIYDQEKAVMQRDFPKSI